MARITSADHKRTAEEFLQRLNPNAEAANDIHSKLRNLVRALILKKLGAMTANFSEGDVEDLIHRTFLIGYINFSKGKELDFSDPPASLQSYFWRIADYLCREFRRDYKRWETGISLTEDESGAAPQLADRKELIDVTLIDNEERKIRRECQLAALKTLPAGERSLMIDYYEIETASANEKKQKREDLAADLGMPVGGLRVKVTRIRAKIRPLNEACLARNGLRPQE